MVALGFMGCDFALPLIEKIGLNEVSDLVDLGKTCPSHGEPRPRYSHRYYHGAHFVEGFSKHRSTGPYGCAPSDDSQWLHYLF